MAYNSNDQRTVPGALQGVTSQNTGAGSETIANSSSVVAPGSPNPSDKTPGYLTVGQPGGNPADVLVPGGQYSGSDNNVQLIGAPAGTAGGGGLYPNITGAAPVQNPFIASGWTAQGSTGDDFLQMVITSALNAMTHAVAFSQQLAASGGDGTNAWSVVAGALPSPLTLSGGGLLSGTPTSAGSATFTVKVVDTHGNQAEHVYSVTVA